MRCMGAYVCYNIDMKTDYKKMNEEFEKIKREFEENDVSRALYGGVVWGLAMGGNEWAQRLLNLSERTHATYIVKMDDLKNDD